jgi:hypothetical protein
MHDCILLVNKRRICKNARYTQFQEKKLIRYSVFILHFILCLGITNSLLFHLAATTCFGNCVPSSGSSPVLSGLHANLGFG